MTRLSHVRWTPYLLYGHSCKLQQALSVNYNRTSEKAGGEVKLLRVAQYLWEKVESYNLNTGCSFLHWDKSCSWRNISGKYVLECFHRNPDRSHAHSTGSLLKTFVQDTVMHSYLKTRVQTHKKCIHKVSFRHTKLAKFSLSPPLRFAGSLLWILKTICRVYDQILENLAAKKKKELHVMIACIKSSHTVRDDYPDVLTFMDKMPILIILWIAFWVVIHINLTFASPFALCMNCSFNYLCLYCKH